MLTIAVDAPGKRVTIPLTEKNAAVLARDTAVV